MILAIETSTMFASAAVVDGDEARAERTSEARTHSEKLVDLIDAVLGDAGVSLGELDGIAVGAGPGSFTGLRIGMATAKGLCFAADRPLWAVSSLAALALAGSRETDAVLVPVLNAYRKEVFAGAFETDDGAVRSLGDEVVVGPRSLLAALPALPAPARLFGDGLELYADAIAETLGDHPSASLWREADGAPQRPHATDVGRLARRADPAASMAAVAPVYIRKSEAEIRYPDGNPGGSYTPNPPAKKNGSS